MKPLIVSELLNFFILDIAIFVVLPISATVFK